MRPFYIKRGLATKNVKNEQFNSQLLENGLSGIIGETKSSDFNETSQTIRNDAEITNNVELENERMGYG